MIQNTPMAGAPTPAIDPNQQHQVPTKTPSCTSILPRQARPREGRPRRLPTARAVEYVIRGRSGHLRAVAVVTACPFCAGMHLHVARLVFATALRRASCGRGAYVVTLPARQGGEAA